MRPGSKHPFPVTKTYKRPRAAAINPPGDMATGGIRRQLAYIIKRLVAKISIKGMGVGQAVKPADREGKKTAYYTRNSTQT